jgi:nucleotide-binding universal stress UspA family protein
MKRILVALDASPRASAVLAAAMDLARATGAKLRLFRAIPIQPEVPPGLVWELPRGGLGALLAEEARADLETRARDVPTELLDGVSTGVGKAWSAVCAAGREHDADLIVVGTHHPSALDRLLGTTAAKVVNHADRAVLVVR